MQAYGPMAVRVRLIRKLRGFPQTLVLLRTTREIDAPVICPKAIIDFDPFVIVRVFEDRAPPGIMYEIPKDCMVQPFLERELGLKAQFGDEKRWIDRVAAVVTRPICNMAEKNRARL